jgi:Secretion system C-terminal sorting domain
MNLKRNIIGCFLLLAVVAPAQSWSEWQDMSAFVYPEKWFWIYPTNVSQFKAVKKQYWRNNNWSDTTRLTHNMNAAGSPQSALAEVWANGLWSAQATAVYQYDASARWTQTQVGLGTPPAFTPYLRVQNTWNANGQIATTSTDKWQFDFNRWEPVSRDSQSLTHSFSKNWDGDTRQWVTEVRDSARLLRWSPAAAGAWWNEGRITYTRNVGGQVTLVKWEVPTQQQPLVWNPNVVNISYAYNASNQLIEISITGKGLMKDTTISGYRYRFTLNSDGKVAEELAEVYQTRTQSWVNWEKSIYSYHRVDAAEVSERVHLMIAPNPTQAGWTQVRVQNAGIVLKSVYVYDAVGRLVHQQMIDNQPVIDLNLQHLSVGNYLLKVQTNEGAVTQKIVNLH